MGSIVDLEQQPCITIDQVIRRLSQTHGNSVILSSPKDGTDVYVDYTGHDVDRLTALAGEYYAGRLQGLGVVDREVVAMVGISSLDYYLTFLALQRLGMTSMFLSPRLADQGFEHLLRSTGCKVVIASDDSIQTLQRVGRTAGLELTIIPLLTTTTSLPPEDDVHVQLDSLGDSEGQGFIIHSGGTTGLPKPVRLQAKAWLLQAANIGGRMPKVDTLSTLPLFHSFGLATLLRCLVNGKRLSIVNASRPITASAILSGLSTTTSQALVTVPYILGFFTEFEGGVQRLACLKQVIAAGSAIPDALGDELAAAGTNLFHLYGQTESGALMEPSKDQWNWVTPLPATERYLKFEPLEATDGNGQLYHLVILPGLQAKVMSNREDGSYETKDLFQRHPADARKWKFVARQDDLVVLVNGEKADPTPLEDAVGRNINVRAAVVFGAQRDSLGMVVIPSERASHLNKLEILHSILPDVELGNCRVPAYARISSDSIVVKDVGTAFPTTDKATVIRSRFLKQFEEDIEVHYATKEMRDGGATDVADDVVPFIVHGIVRRELGPKAAGLTETSDFFSLGMDSLQATNVRSRILKAMSLPTGKTLTTNVVFDHPSVQLLSLHLLTLRGAAGTDRQPLESVALGMIERYSHFRPSEPGVRQVDGEHILLTGATGTIGSHILFSLISRDHVREVYCLVRAADNDDALLRVKDALLKARLSPDITPAQMEKIVALPCNLAGEDLGLTTSTYQKLRTVTAIIHNAWSVNFNMGLESFEIPCISGTRHLLNLASSSVLSKKPTFTFISSIASVLNAPEMATATGKSGVTETRHGWEGVSPSMGYGQSKWVAEEICFAASETAGIATRVVRVGQVAGDTKHGIWNAAEAIPTTVQCALAIGALPLLEEGESQEMSWLPVDVTAAAVAELALLDKVSAPEPGVPRFSVFHVANSRTLKWNDGFLSALKEHGLEFEALPQRKWLGRLEESNSDVVQNPAYKLLEFFRGRYGTVSSTPEPCMDTTESQRFAPSLSDGTSINGEMVGKFLRYWMEDAWAQR